MDNKAIPGSGKHKTGQGQEWTSIFFFLRFKQYFNVLSRSVFKKSAFKLKSGDVFYFFRLNNDQNLQSISPNNDLLLKNIDIKQPRQCIKCHTALLV